MDAIGRAVRAGGVKIADASLREMVRRERAIYQHGQSLKYANRDKLIDTERLPTALGRMRNLYSFVVRVSGTDMNTGQKVTRRVTVSTSQRLTRGQIEDAAFMAGAGLQGSFGMEGEEAMLESGQQVGEFGTV